MERIIHKLKTQQIKKAVFIRLRSIGDTVLLTPSIKVFKSAYPNCHLAVLVENPSAEVLIENQYIDELIIFNHKRLKDQSVLKFILAQFRFYLSLINKNFDIVFNFHGGSRSLFLTLITLAKYRIGLINYRFPFLYSHILYNIRETLAIDHMPHAVENQYAMLKWAGADVSKIELDIPASEKYREQIIKLLQQVGIAPVDRYMVIHPFSPVSRKAFPISYLAELIDRLSFEFKIKSILTYGPGEKSQIEEIAGLTSCSPILLKEPIHLKMVAELIRGAVFFMGCDTGTMHIAAAVGTPMAALFNGSNCRRWHPWCENYFIVAKNKANCNNKNCRDRVADCIDFNAYDDIIFGIKSLIKKDGRQIL